MNREEINRIVKEHVELVAPGFYSDLELLSKLSFNRRFTDLLVEEPGKLLELLLRNNDPFTVFFVIKYLVLKPILSRIQRMDLLDYLSALFMEDTKEFRRSLIALIGNC